MSIVHDNQHLKTGGGRTYEQINQVGGGDVHTNEQTKERTNKLKSGTYIQTNKQTNERTNIINGQTETHSSFLK